MTGDPRSGRTTKVYRSGPLGGGGVLFWVTMDLYGRFGQDGRWWRQEQRRVMGNIEVVVVVMVMCSGGGNGGVIGTDGDS
ncbi:hypothetical protein M6B38_368420 [Iris pallida]|uniref:Uncharacterized protein n=1 Tax=Iris pallida TaxID=29817 RepID=A0AAX6GGP1_IRIPA|nr:hypothetical protein M6B38_368420 [Iris pallida]